MPKKRPFRIEVRVYCAEHEITQGQLAERLGIDEGKFSRVLSGQAVPNINELAALEKLFGVSASDFADVEHAKRVGA